MAEAIDNLKVDDTSWADKAKARRANLVGWLGTKLKAGWTFTARVVVDELLRRAIGK